MKTAVQTRYKLNKPFSMGIETAPVLFVSGQGGIDMDTGTIVGPDIESQTIRTIANIQLVLEAAGCMLDDVVKVNVYLSDRSLYDAFNDIYGRLFRHPYPSRTTVYCDLNYGLLVEIDAIAVRSGEKGE